ncbi:MAG: class I SAM-dependent methyltransferase [Acidobacteria bacterium]|nr:class I SAM-dependent methyltransferase [Acidobacteriota bacterium]
MCNRSMLEIEPTKRFSSRVEHYVCARPAYPKQILQVLSEECGFSPAATVADIASGTGIFTRLLLENGNRIFAVEPNQEMRRAAEESLAQYANFSSVEGTAERTTLPDGAVDFITCAQAAHWFDAKAARREFQRILKPEGFLILVWNDRRIVDSPFAADYEELITQYGIDYIEVKRRGTGAAARLFASYPYRQRRLSNFQELDYRTLEQRLLSSSYVPQLNHERCAPMLAKLRKIFDCYQQSGRIRMDYDTKLYLGRLREQERQHI